MATWTTDTTAPNLSSPYTTRSPGLHLTDVLIHIQNANLTLQGKSPPPYQHNPWAEAGNEFEWAFKQRLQDRYPNYCDPGELCIDTPDGKPLFLTPDLYEEFQIEGEHTPQNCIRVWDIKWTTKSSTLWNPTLETDTTWYIRSQLACYCKVFDTLYGGFHIRHLRGNYADENYQHRTHRVTFELWEIETIWAEVMAMAVAMNKR